MPAKKAAKSDKKTKKGAKGKTGRVGLAIYIFRIIRQVGGKKFGVSSRGMGCVIFCLSECVSEWRDFPPFFASWFLCLFVSVSFCVVVCDEGGDRGQEQPKSLKKERGR